MHADFLDAGSWRALGAGISRVFTLQRLITFAFCVLLATVAIAQIGLVAHREGMFYADRDVPVGADFLVFYTAGRIAAAGDGRDLYDPVRQANEQREILGRDRGLAIFPYPAFVAVPYALLAHLSLPWAYAIATLAMIAATFTAVLLLRNVSPTVRAHPVLVSLIIMSSQPFNAALLGGQPVAFTFLCFAGIYAGMRRERHVQTGVWLALLLYKPQMAVVLLLLLAYRWRWRSLAAAGAMAAGLVLLGCAVAGIDWPFAFWQLVSGDYFRTNALVADGIRSISIPGVIAHLAGENAGSSRAVAMLLCLAVLLLLLRAWRDLEPTGDRFPLQFGAAIAGTLLISPHALFYEAGLLVLPILLLADRWGTIGPRRLLTLLALFGLGHAWALAETVGLEPLALLPLWVGILALLELRRSATAPEAGVPGLASPRFDSTSTA